MPQFNVRQHNIHGLYIQATDLPQITLAKDASDSELEKAKQHVKDQGGEIVSEFSLIKGFTYVTLLRRANAN
jgi:hypothetical protein